jgi:molybdopterin molybdotransferase
MLRAASTVAIRKKPGRTEYQRGIVTRVTPAKNVTPAQAGAHTSLEQWQVEITGSQGSGILRSMSQANGLVVLHHEQGDVQAGEPVDVLPFDGLV